MEAPVTGAPETVAWNDALEAYSEASKAQIEKLVREYSHTYYLTAGECDPEARLPMPLIVSRLIEVATEHANAWGVGYSRLKEDGQAWVLSRVSVEMHRYPHVNEEYVITTWVESYNRHFSERNFSITDGVGNEIGTAKSIWMVIDTRQRVMCDISKLSYISRNVSERRSPMGAVPRLAQVKEGRCEPYTFGYIDLDSNRHVNSVSYVKILMNRLRLEHYDAYRMKRLDIAYMKECLGGETVNIHFDDRNELDISAEIEADGVARCRARMQFEACDYREECVATEE
ncbi:MAG: acyl-[acyl-carrier-protein] thioesterase [Muribaculaceae bacterium]